MSEVCKASENESASLSIRHVHPVPTSTEDALLSAIYRTCLRMLRTEERSHPRA